MSRQSYDTDLTLRPWQLLCPLLPPAKPGGRPRTTNLLEVVNAIFYLLPHDLPRWPTVYTYFRRWPADGTWQTLNRTLREYLRVQAGRNRLPSAACVDSQSVKTAGAAHRKWI